VKAGCGRANLRCGHRFGNQPAGPAAAPADAVASSTARGGSDLQSPQASG